MSLVFVFIAAGVHLCLSRNETELLKVAGDSLGKSSYCNRMTWYCRSLREMCFVGFRPRLDMKYYSWQMV